MKIVKATELGLPAVTVRELIKDFNVDADGGIRCYGGRLNPRPSYQREFVYNDNDQREVFKTLNRGFPLGTFYWCETEQGHYELIDGQQRTLSIINIVNGDVYLERDEDKIYWDRLAESSQDAILDQELNVYICKGDPTEKMEWFRTINIVGRPLTIQEIRSATYDGPFLQDAKRWFVFGGSSSCPAVLNDYKSYVKGNIERQELLEKVLYWHSDAEGFTGTKDDMINEYLRKHRKDENADALWGYYDAVIRWADMLFNDHSHNYSKEQEKVEWGLLYNLYHTKTYEPKKIQKTVVALMENPEIDKKDGIYSFVFDGKVKNLSPRKFKDADKRAKYEEQHHKCMICDNEIKDISNAHADHIIPWSKGGRTEMANLQILCVDCNLKESNKESAEASKEFSFAD